MIALALVVAAAPSVELRALRAGLLTDQLKPIGSLDDGALVVQRWVSATVMLARHESPVVQLDAFVDVSREGTFVEAVATREVALSSQRGWVVVLEKGSRVPLLGKVNEGLRVGFLERWVMPVNAATVPDVERPVPAADLPDTPCWVRALHSLKDGRSARWEPSTASFEVHLGSADADGWAPAYADGDVARVHGFVRSSDVVCDVGAGGGLGLAGFGGASDGFTHARAGVLPAGTKLYWSKTAAEPFATLRAPAEGLLTKEGWRFKLVSGETRVVLSGVTVKVEVPLEPEKLHGFGSPVVRQPDWPRLKGP